jgi:hypothetical protein
MTTRPPIFNFRPWDGTPRELGEVWHLTKGTHVAVCTLRSHPKGGELRLTVDGEWQRGEALADGDALLDLAAEWRKQIEAKGWAA